MRDAEKFAETASVCAFTDAWAAQKDPLDISIPWIFARKLGLGMEERGIVGRRLRCDRRGKGFARQIRDGGRTSYQATNGRH